MISRLPLPPKTPWASLEEALIESEPVALKTSGQYQIRSLTADRETVKPARAK